MSIKSLSWALEQDVKSSSVKFVLVALANFSSDEGKCFPSVQTLCSVTCQHRETVYKALQELARLDFVKDTGEVKGFTGRVKVYQLPEEAWKINMPKNQTIKYAEKPDNSENKVSGKPDDLKVSGKPDNTLEEASNCRSIVGQYAEKPDTDPRTMKDTDVSNINNKRQWGENVPIPEELNTAEFKRSWQSWLNDRAQRKKRVTTFAAELQLNDLKAWGVDLAIQSIKNSISNSYQGLFKPKENKRQVEQNQMQEEIEVRRL